MSGQPTSLSGELVALPSLERAIPSLEGHDRGGFGLGPGGGADSLDGSAARQKALDVVRSAVELADRIESQARDSASERLRRADEDVSARRQELEQREREVEHFSAELERRQQETAEASQKAQALVDGAQQDAAQTLERARAEAQTHLEQARAEAQALVEQARAEAHAHVEQARAEAQALLERARQEATGQVDKAREEAEQLRRSEREKVDGAVEHAVQQALALVAQQAAANGNGAAPAGHKAAGSNGDGLPAEDTTAPAFVPPPLSPEDLAAVSTLPRLGGSQRPVPPGD